MSPALRVPRRASLSESDLEVRRAQHEQRFWSLVQIGDLKSCWPYLGTVGPNGYGRFRMDNRSISAHRAIFSLLFGEPDPSHSVCHSCDNRLCCNPGHLWVGTSDANNKDMMRKGRTCKGEDQPSSKLTEKQIVEIRQETQLKKELLLLLDRESGYSALAKRYGVSLETIRAAARGSSWKHVKKTSRPTIVRAKHKKTVTFRVSF